MEDSHLTMGYVQHKELIKAGWTKHTSIELQS
jgi:hypothetical protein